jgi:hypothetical protein
MALDLSIKPETPDAMQALPSEFPARVFYVFPSYFAEFTGIFASRLRGKVTGCRLHALVCPVEFPSASRRVSVA